MLTFERAWTTPGLAAAQENYEGQVWWGGWFHQPVIVPVMLDGAARDAGANPTTILRPGLLLGVVTATGKWKEWSPTATDGTEHIAGILLYEATTQAQGSNTDRWFGYAMVAGYVKSAEIVVPGEATKGLAGKSQEFFVRSLLTQTGRFMLDDQYFGATLGGWQRVVARTSDYTLTAADNNTLFTNEGAVGAVTFTLPQARQGFRCGFYVVENQNVTIAANPTDTLVVYNDNAADSVTLSTAGERIGGFFEVIQTSSRSLVIPHLWEGQTPTIAT